MPRPRPVRCAWWPDKREALARLTQGKQTGPVGAANTAQPLTIIKMEL